MARVTHRDLVTVIAREPRLGEQTHQVVQAVARGLTRAVPLEQMEAQQATDSVVGRVGRQRPDGRRRSAIEVLRKHRERAQPALLLAASSMP